MLTIGRAFWVLCVVSSCAAATKREEGSPGSAPPTLVAQRVTATVKREATWLVHVQTEHEALVTTPEHPFATPHSGWIPAGRLVPGDRVVSAKFGAVRVVSLRNERPAEPLLVYNLTVDPSHAYMVGRDQVLVHNRKCKDLAEKEEEIQEAERKLEELERQLSIPTEDEEKLKRRIAAAKSEVAQLKRELRKALSYREKKANTEPRIGTAWDKRLLKEAEADYESRRQRLAATQRELFQLVGEEPLSDAENKALAERAAALEEKIKDLQSELDVSKEILAGERKIAELMGRSPSTAAERVKIEQDRRDLRAMLSKKRKARSNREETRRSRGDPDAREKRIRGHGEAPAKRLRTADYEAIWREAEAEGTALEETVQDEAEDVDAALRALAESLERSPSPARTAAVESGLQALQRELREERSAVETADFDLANLHAFLSQTLGGPGSSHYAAGAQRLAEVQQQRMQLRTDWRERMQRRLDAARQEFEALQTREPRDGLAEAELAQKIALLEHEVNNPSF